MSYRIKTRYGHTETNDDLSDAAEVVEKLIRELETEEFEEPDDEHTQIAVSHGVWSLTVQVSGLLTLDDLTDLAQAKVPPSLHLRAEKRSQVKNLLLMMALGRIDDVRAAGWVVFEQLAPHRKDFFRP